MRIHSVISQFIGLSSGTHKCGIQISVLIGRKLFVNANDPLTISTAKLFICLAGVSSVLNSAHAKPYNTNLSNHHSRCIVG